MEEEDIMISGSDCPTSQVQNEEDDNMADAEPDDQANIWTENEEDAVEDEEAKSAVENSDDADSDSEDYDDDLSNREIDEELKDICQDEDLAVSTEDQDATDAESNKTGPFKISEGKPSQETELAMKNATVSKAAGSGQCVFACPECDGDFSLWSKLVAHMKADHRMIPKSTCHKNFLRKATVHTCKVCWKKVICDTYFMQNHITIKHRLTLPKYRKKYNLARLTGSMKMCSSKLSELLEKGRLSTKRIGSFCEFTCPECSKTYTSLKGLERHGRKCIENFSREFLHEYLSVIVSHRCLICSELLLCDSEYIAQHIRKHGFKTIWEYGKKVGCAVATKVHPPPKQKPSPKAISKANKLKGNLISKSYSVPRLPAQKQAKGNLISKSVGNLCKYACGKCDYIGTTWKSMKDHLEIRKHYSPFGSDCKKHRCNTVLHKCMVCRKNLLNEKHLLNSHLMDSHKIDLPRYVRKYGLKVI